MWGKTNLHQDKIFLPLTCLPFSPPLPLPLLIHTRPIPIPHTFRSQPTHLLSPIPLPFCPQPALFPSPSHSPSVRSPLSFRPQPTPRPSATHSPSIPSPLSPLRYSPNLFICYPVSSRIQLVPSSPRQLVNLPVTPRTCSSVTLSINTTNLLTHLPINSSTYNVTHRTCSSVTMSPLAYNLLTRLPVNSSTCPLLSELVHLLPCLLSPPTCSLVHSSTRQLTMLLSELVHLLPCLLIHLTCSLVHSLTRLLVNYFYHLTFLSVLV